MPRPDSPTLREALADWVDLDLAMHLVAEHMGLIPREVPFPKHVYWASNQLGDAITDILDALQAIGAVEYDVDDLRFRWNPAFDWKVPAGTRGR